MKPETRSAPWQLPAAGTQAAPSAARAAAEPSAVSADTARGATGTQLTATVDTGTAAERAQRHWQHGLALGQADRWPEAARAFGRATRLQRSDARYWLNLCHAQRRAGALVRAVVAARRCLQWVPAQPLALRLLAVSLVLLNRHADALVAFETLQASGQTDGDVLLLQAASLLALARTVDAADLLQQLVLREPKRLRAHLLLGEAWREQGRHAESAASMQAVIALDPGHIEAQARLLFEQRRQADWSAFEQELATLQRLLVDMPEAPPRITAAFSLLSLPLDEALQLRAARSESKALTQGVQPLGALKPRAVCEPRLAPNAATPPTTATSAPTAVATLCAPIVDHNRRIRLGFLSHDFRTHPVAQLLAPVFDALDRSRFELVLYAIGPDDDSPLRTRLRATADRFVDLHALPDRRAAECIRADGIDLLVDLMGHTRGARLAILAHRPAPVQVAFLGYPGSSGADCIDYLIGDPLVTPLSLAGQCSEHLAQMPVCFQPNGRERPLPIEMAPAERAFARLQAGLPADAVVLCAFNHAYKILPQCFAIWCQTLRDLPQAVLWLKTAGRAFEQHIHAAAAAHGVEPARIVFASHVALDAHHARLALADLFVDTWPYNAHTTAADALWAGVPVVTCRGSSFASRVAASCLAAVGLGDLAFDSPASYRDAIVSMARDPARLASLRHHLQHQRLQLPLFDTGSYTLALQSLLARMVQRWRDGLAPAHLAAEPATTAQLPCSAISLTTCETAPPAATPRPTTTTPTNTPTPTPAPAMPPSRKQT